ERARRVREREHDLDAAVVQPRGALAEVHAADDGRARAQVRARVGGVPDEGDAKGEREADLRAEDRRRRGPDGGAERAPEDVVGDQDAGVGCDLDGGRARRGRTRGPLRRGGRGGREEQELEQHERAGISSDVEFCHGTSRESLDGSVLRREACAVPTAGRGRESRCGAVFCGTRPRAGAQTVIAKGRPCVYLSRRHAVDRRRGCVVPLPRADTAREVLAFSPASEPTIVQERCMPSVPHAPAAGAATRDAVPTYTPEV